jgi:hypothetical protein
VDHFGALAAMVIVAGDVRTKCKSEGTGSGVVVEFEREDGLRMCIAGGLVGLAAEMSELADRMDGTVERVFGALVVGASLAKR